MAHQGLRPEHVTARAPDRPRRRGTRCAGPPPSPSQLHRSTGARTPPVAQCTVRGSTACEGIHRQEAPCVRYKGYLRDDLGYQPEAQLPEVQVHLLNPRNTFRQTNKRPCDEPAFCKIRQAAGSGESLSDRLCMTTCAAEQDRHSVTSNTAPAVALMADDTSTPSDSGVSARNSSGV